MRDLHSVTPLSPSEKTKGQADVDSGDVIYNPCHARRRDARSLTVPLYLFASPICHSTSVPRNKKAPDLSDAPVHIRHAAEQSGACEMQRLCLTIYLFTNATVASGVYTEPPGRRSLFIKLM